MEEVVAYLLQHYIDPYMPPWLKLVFMTYLTTSWLANTFCAKTATPPPNTTWGEVYGWVEWYGGIYGKAKEVGIPVPLNLSVAELKTDVQQLAADIEKGR